MKMVERLLSVRKAVKSRKPTYRRQQVNQYAKFKRTTSWRRPKGYQSKMRIKGKGHHGMPEVGYGSPKAVKGLNKDGFLEVLVKNVADLKAVDKKSQVAVIGATVGGRKKLDILNEAKKLKIGVANVKDVDAKIKALTKAPKEKKVIKATATKASEKKADVKKEASEK